MRIVNAYFHYHLEIQVKVDWLQVEVASLNRVATHKV